MQFQIWNIWNIWNNKLEFAVIIWPKSCQYRLVLTNEFLNVLNNDWFRFVCDIRCILVWKETGKAKVNPMFIQLSHNTDEVNWCYSYVDWLVESTLLEHICWFHLHIIWNGALKTKICCKNKILRLGVFRHVAAIRESFL